jgi:hypothetical protein
VLPGGGGTEKKRGNVGGVMEVRAEIPPPLDVVTETHGPHSGKVGNPPRPVVQCRWVDCAPVKEKKRFSSLVFYFFLDEPPRQKDGITDFHLKLLIKGP